MSKFVVVLFPSETAAYEGTRTFKQLHAEGILTLYGMAVLAKDATGRIAIKQNVDEGPLGTAAGALIGGLVGLIGGPAGAVLGMSAGALFGGIGDIVNLGVRADFIDAVASKLVAGKAAVIAEAVEDWMAPLDMRMEALGGEVIRQWRTDFEDEQLAKFVEEQRAEFAAVRDEINRAGADAKKTLNKRLDEARAKLDDAGKRAEARLNQLESEANAKVKELQAQIAAASGEAKANIEKRLAKMQADYKRRTDMLKQAWSLAKEALGPEGLKKAS